jgi:hypothetical protein
MEYENKQKQEGNGEHIAFESPLEEYFKIQPVLTHVKLGKIDRSHPDQVKNGKKQVIFRQVNGIRSEYCHTGK